MNSVGNSLVEPIPAPTGAPSPAPTTASSSVPTSTSLSQLPQQQQQQPQPPPSPSPSQPPSTSETAPTPLLPPISSPSAPPASLSAVLAASAASSVSIPSLATGSDELPPLRQPSPSSPAHYSFEQHQQQQQHHHHHLQPLTPPVRKDTSSSISTQATTATLASTETNNTSYSAETSPNLHQSIFSLKDGSDVSNNRRTSRRRTGPLSQQSRERAALIRKLGACVDCRRRRVACHPSHHNMTWEDVVSKFHRSHSPTIQDIAPSLAAAGRPLSPAPAITNVQSIFTHDPQEMDIDSGPPAHQPGRPPLSETRIRTPLPSGPRLEKSLSLPGIESLKNDLQTNVGRMLSTPSRDRYSSVQALLLFWQDDDEVANVQSAVQELADVFEKYYRYSFQAQAIPSTTENGRSPWRWLSRQVNDFAEDRDTRDVLKIVFYVGHTFLDGNREMVLASSRDPERASTIRWGGIQSILEEATADTLIIMDAAYYPSSRMVRQQGVLELVAAAASDEHFAQIDKCAFTRTLADQLRTRALRQNVPFSAAELHSHLFAHYPRIVQEKNPEKELITSFPAPLHLMMSSNPRLPSIFLSPLYQNGSMRNSLSYESSPQLHLSIRLTDDNVNVESWNEWLRMMPEGIRDVKVEGPYRPAFR